MGVTKCVGFIIYIMRPPLLWIVIRFRIKSSTDGHGLSLLFSTLLFLLDLTLVTPCHTLTKCLDIDCEPFDRFVGGCSVWTRVGDCLPAAAARPRRDAQADGQ